MVDMESVFQTMQQMSIEELEMTMDEAHELIQVGQEDSAPPLFKLGLHEGQTGFWMADDFNDPLPDAFWSFDDDFSNL